MLLLLFSIIYLIDQTLTLKLYLSVEENTRPSNAIGNLQLMVRNQSKVDFSLDSSSLQYNIENSEISGPKNFIKIDPKTGDIWLQSALDREELCSMLNNCEGNTFLDYLVYVDKAVYELKIEILDINDNSPTFNPDEKQIEIPEGIAKSTIYSLPVAKDKDSEKYGVKKYVLKSISNSDDEKYFKLTFKDGTNSPYLKVVRDLDRELKDSFEFYLFAIDGGTNQGKCKISIKITDINDNTPQWIGLPYRQKIRECTTDYKVKQLMAQDSDDKSTDGGQIRYKISENSANSDFISRTFFITDDTLYLNNGALRLYGQNKLSVFVVATDGGGRTNETTVEVEIIDCNDHAPTITIFKQLPTINENDYGVKSLTTITVKDQDHGINSEFNCSLNDTNHVTITLSYTNNDAKNRIKIYNLKTVADTSFDREKTPRHSVEIQCVDNGQPAMSSSSIITVYVIDQNDNKPTFDTEFKIFTLSEDTRIGSEVGRVIATDDDVSPNNVITYSIIGDKESCSTFSVTNHGQIHLLTSIDREKIDKYEFKIVAIDNGKPSMNDSCGIKILVSDVNDCAPEIAKDFHFTIVESFGGDATHKNFGKLNATDRDHGHNGSIMFRLKSIYPSEIPMKVLSDGRLSIYGVIDREKNERIEAEILVIDGGRPPLISTTTVTIEVLDLNDNKPKFQFPNSKYHHSINVSLDMSVGTMIGQLKVTDPDKDANGTVDFTLMGNESQKKMFIINQDGQIMLNEKLNSNRKIDNRLYIEAKDRGVPPQSETTTLYIRVLPPKADLLDVKRNSYPSSRNEKFNDTNAPKYGWSNVMTLIYFLAAAIFLIIIGIGGTFLYLWCRGQMFCASGDSNKHVSSRELNSAGYPKNLPKGDKNQSVLEINNQFLTSRKDTSYQIIDPQCQVLNYPSLMKTYASPTLEHPYQFRSMIIGGNYSAFNPRSSSPIIDKDSQELSPFTSTSTYNNNNNNNNTINNNEDSVWDHSPQVFSTIDVRNRNLSNEMDNVYDNHKYSVALPNNYDNNSHFPTPSQRQRSDTVNSKNDASYKAKVNYVASSFV